MDEIDQANATMEDFQAFALNLNRIGRDMQNYTGIYCIDCDEEIPVIRKAAQPGCCRCIGCQIKYERIRRG